ncbi:hypothetical protein AAZX31_20G046700 [Glycine max]
MANLFLYERIKNCFFQMHSNKSRDPCGLNASFYKRFWYLCVLEILSSSTTWLENGSFPHELNNNTIVLIPKNTDPKSMKDYKPISLLF